MGQFSNVLLAFDNAHTVPQRDLDCGPGIGGLNQVYGPNFHTSFFFFFKQNKIKLHINGKRVVINSKNMKQLRSSGRVWCWSSGGIWCWSPGGVWCW